MVIFVVYSKILFLITIYYLNRLTASTAAQKGVTIGTMIEPEIRPTERSSDLIAPTHLMTVLGTETTFTRALTVRGYAKKNATKTVIKTVTRIVRKIGTRTETKIAKKIVKRTGTRSVIETIVLLVTGTGVPETPTEGEVVAAITTTGELVPHPRTSLRKLAIGRSTSARLGRSTITIPNRRCHSGRSHAIGLIGKRRRKERRENESGISGTDVIVIGIETAIGTETENTIGHLMALHRPERTKTRMALRRDIPTLADPHPIVTTAIVAPAVMGIHLPQHARQTVEKTTGIISNLSRSRRSPEGTVMVLTSL